MAEIVALPSHGDSGAVITEATSDTSSPRPSKWLGALILGIIFGFFAAGTAWILGSSLIWTIAAFYLVSFSGFSLLLVYADSRDQSMNVQRRQG